jgi:hypothetical protein
MGTFQTGDKDAVVTPALDDALVCSQAGIVKQITTEQILSLIGDKINLVNFGWMADTNTWTYASANTNFPEYTFTIPVDATGYLKVGQKIKLTQLSLKYFIIVKVVYSSPNTTVTLYGGGTALTSPYYATIQRPLDFSMGENTWSTTLIDSTLKSRLSIIGAAWWGGSNSWTSGSNITMYLGTGIWKIYVKALLLAQNNNLSGSNYPGFPTIALTFSYDSNDWIQERLTNWNRNNVQGVISNGQTLVLKSSITLTEVTQFWLLGYASSYSNLYVHGDKIPTIIKVTSAYL